jgi:hypothetical protein
MTKNIFKQIHLYTLSLQGIGKIFVDHGSPTVLLPSATPVIVVWFMGCTLKIIISGISTHLNYCVILVSIHNLQMWLQAA